MKLPSKIEIMGDTVKLSVRVKLPVKRASAYYDLRRKRIIIKQAAMFELKEVLFHEIVEYIMSKQYLIRSADDGCRYMTFNHEPYSKYGDAFSILVITILDTIKRNKLQWLFT